MNILKKIDGWLNKITMYRLMVCGLLVQAAVAYLLAAFGILSFSAWQLLGALVLLVGVSIGSNLLFGRWTRAAVNAESMVITGFLLFFVLDPSVASVRDVLLLSLAAILAEVSKYVFAYRARHVFNPVAVAAFLMALFGLPLATWWVATPWMIPTSLLFGAMVVRKIRRWDMVMWFVLAAGFMAIVRGVSVTSLVLSWPLVFFGTLMLTEPRTAPSRVRDQRWFGAGVGLLFASMISVRGFSMTPELALMIGNIFAALVSSRGVIRLTFKEMKKETEQIRHFIFTPDRPLSFLPGQYVEWTLPLHKRLDNRGNRRFFTVASAPSDRQEVHLGIRVESVRSSQFKTDLMALTPGDTMVVSHVAGDFVLPDTVKKVGWIAGGIGITPFRSMMREMKHVGAPRDVVLLNCVNTETDIAYKQEFESAKEIGIRMECVVAKPTGEWRGAQGFLTQELCLDLVPDARERVWFLSGPPMMVQNYVGLLKKLGVAKANIKTDYFPGF